MRISLFVLSVTLAITSGANGTNEELAACMAALEKVENRIGTLKVRALLIHSQIDALKSAREKRARELPLSELSLEDRPYAPVDKLGLSVRSAAKLEQEGIHTIKVLLMYSRADLVKLFQETSAAEIDGALRKYGLHLEPPTPVKQASH